MKKSVLRLRSRRSLIEKRPNKRLFYDGPFAGATGLYFTRPFDRELLKLDPSAQVVVWRVSTTPLVQFDTAFIRDELIVGNGAAAGVAAFREDSGAPAWQRLDLGGAFPRKRTLWSRARGAALVEIDIVTGEDVRRLAIGDEWAVVGAADEDVVLRSDHLVDFWEHRDREAARPYRGMSLVDGRVVWERNLAQQAWEAAGQAPHFVSNLMPGSLGDRWIGRWRSSTFACSRGDGSLLWFAKDVECGPRADVRDGRVMGMTVGGGRFHVLDERTGAVLWTYDGRELGGAAYPRPAAFLGEYAVYGMESGHLAVFDPREGRLVWSTLHKAPISDVRIIDGLVYVTTGKGELLVYECTESID